MYRLVTSMRMKRCDAAWETRSSLTAYYYYHTEVDVFREFSLESMARGICQIAIMN